MSVNIALQTTGDHCYIFEIQGINVILLAILIKKSLERLKGSLKSRCIFFY